MSVLSTANVECTKRGFTLLPKVGFQYIRSNLLKIDHFVATMGGNTVEPKLLQLPSLGFVEANDPIFLKTLEKIEEKYKKGKFIVVEDEWNGLHNTTPSGVPSVEIIPKPKKTTAILAPIITKSDGEILTRALSKKKNIARTIHTLWYIQALAK